MVRFDSHEKFNIDIAYDTTDHFSLICPDCGADMVIYRCYTTRGKQIDFKGTKDNCTYLCAYCPDCKTAGQRKIYWNSYKHEGRCERGRTNWKREFRNSAKIKEAGK